MLAAKLSPTRLAIAALRVSMATTSSVCAATRKARNWRNGEAAERGAVPGVDEEDLRPLVAPAIRAPAAPPAARFRLRAGSA